MHQPKYHVLNSVSPFNRVSGGITRRRFLWVASMSAAGMAAGCATDPVTGKSQFNLVSEQQEIEVDKQYAPQQLSSDYGVTQDAQLNRYIKDVGAKLVTVTHRKNMPYNFQVVNATYVNAYAFPGGTIAATRGIMLSLENEAELAALIGHELGHVNARHTAEQMTKSQITSTLLGGVQAAIGMTKYGQYAGIAGQLGQLGAGVLLAKYSRENEREADDLGNQYMVKAGYSTQGFVGLMEMLKSMSNHKSNAVEMLFSTHPMSDERYQTALEYAEKYQGSEKNPLHKERYMDNTAKLRAIAGAVANMQKGEAAMAGKQYDAAHSAFSQALKQVPNDYAGLLLMSKCLLAQQKTEDAGRYAEKAKQVYPQEAQAYQVTGFVSLQKSNFGSALQDLSRYDQLLPGNPAITFYKGYCYEGMQKKEPAAAEYKKFLSAVNQGEQAQHAYNRLVEWGFVKKQ